VPPKTSKASKTNKPITVNYKISFIGVKRLKYINVLSSLHILSVPVLMLVYTGYTVYTSDFNSQEALEGLLKL